MLSGSYTAADLVNLDGLLNNVVMACHPRNWDEDHITRSWLTKIRDDWTKLNITRPSVSVSWEAYKMDGKLEEKNGDVAFVVELVFPNKNKVTGVGFLEAKRIYESNQFDQLKWVQLKKLSENSSAHQLLLYDHDPRKTYFSGIRHDVCATCGWKNCSFSVPSPTSSAMVASSYHALAFETKTRDLEDVLGYRLSEQILQRYLRGLDLNFDTALVKSVISGIPGGPKFLAVVTVAVGDHPSANPNRPRKGNASTRPAKGSIYVRLETTSEDSEPSE